MSDKSSDSTPDLTTVARATAVRAARVLLAMSQEELARQVGFSKAPLARFETLSAPLSEEAYAGIMDFVRENGVIVKAGPDGVMLSIDGSKLDDIRRRLISPDRKRADRGRKRGPRHRKSP